MLKRTLYFGSPYRFSCRNAQLVMHNKDTGEEHTAPVEDIGLILFDHPQISYSQAVIQELAEHNCALVVCDRKHMPQSLTLPLDTGHYIQQQRFNLQQGAGVALKKRLWQQTVSAKIRNQAELLRLRRGDYKPLIRMSRNVKVGDASNTEGNAAAYYWKRLFDDPYFIRDRDGLPPNNALNYGYAVLRASTARALVAAGLFPMFGIQHHNRANAYCLADDIMEPFRPFIDLEVSRMEDEELDLSELDRTVKQRLLSVLTTDADWQGKTTPLQIALSRSANSLVYCLTGEAKQLNYPSLCNVNAE